MSPSAAARAAVRSRTFCCCVPVRAGLILLALLGSFGGGLISTVGIIGLKQSSGHEKSLIIQTVVYIVLCIISCIGLVGGIGRKLVLVRIYFGMLIVHLFLSIGSGSYAIYRVFHDSTAYVNECIHSRASDPTAPKTCRAGASMLKSLMISTFVVFWLIEIWGCNIVHNYNRQLAEEEGTRSVIKDTEAW